MSKLYLIVVAVCLFNVITADKVPFSDCGSKTGIIESVDVEGCTASPCSLIKGTDAKMTISFKSSVDTATLTNKCYGVIAFIPVPFPLPEADACKMGAICPVKQGESHSIQVALPILKEYPSLSVDVKWQILDQSSKVLGCFKIPVKIRSP